jgi:hypothetical protein
MTSTSVRNGGPFVHVLQRRLCGGAGAAIVGKAKIRRGPRPISGVDTATSANHESDLTKIAAPKYMRA